MTATDIKTALRARHPGAMQGSMVGQWTCLEEWAGVDLLAISAWSSKPSVIAYEVKVSRSDMRRELLNPGKRAAAVALSCEFWFAVPAGLLTAAELRFVEPTDWTAADFDRPACDLPDRERWSTRARGRCLRRVPVPCVLTNRYSDARYAERPDVHFDRSAAPYGSPAWTMAACDACGGTGHADRSRVEREAPVLWLPPGVGLIEVHPSGVARAKVKPRRRQNTGPLARREVRDVIRWASNRPDPRHVSPAPQCDCHDFLDTVSVAA